MFRSNRITFAAVAITCICLLAYGYYLQYFRALEPCPLCIFQRIAYLSIAIIGAIAAVHNPARLGARIYIGLMAISAIAGIGVAGRQTWLQHLPPDKVPECGPGLDFMLEMYPLGETILKTLRGTGDCAVVDWQFLGLSIAEWSLLCFIGLLCVLVLQVFLARSKSATK